MHLASDHMVPIGMLNDLHEARTKEDLLRTFSKWSQYVIKADRCGVALPYDNKHLMLTTMTGSTTLDPGIRYRIEDSFVGTVFTSQRALQIDAILCHPQPGTAALAATGVDTLLIAPLEVRGRCFGTIAASFAKGNTPAPSDLDLLCAMGRCLASQLVVIERMDGLASALMTDALTKALNRRYYTGNIETLWTNWEQDHTPFTILLIDIDHFKRINDTYGHAAGDQVLCAFVHRIRSSLRSGDQIVRLGGEEFAVTFANRHMDTGHMVAHRLHQAIRERPFRADGTTLPVTACFGLTEVGPRDQGHHEVFARADAALYQAKQNGRDQVIGTPPEAVLAKAS